MESGGKVGYIILKTGYIHSSKQIMLTLSWVQRLPPLKLKQCKPLVKVHQNECRLKKFLIATKLVKIIPYQHIKHPKFAQSCQKFKNKGTSM